VHRIGRIVAVVALCVALVAATAGGAAATGGDYESSGTSSCLARLDRRVKDVDKLLAKVAAAPDVTAAHRSALTSMLQEARAGLVALRVEIVGLGGGAVSLAAYHEEPATSPEPISPEQQAACERMVTDFRIYALRKPQVHLVLSADRVTGQRALFDILASELQAAIAAASSDPDVAEAQRLLDDYRIRINEASLGAAGVADAVIGFGPADWNANPQILGDYVDVMREVKHDLKTAKKDARQIVALLSAAQPEKTGK
jgi:hypothetical protein